MRPAQQLEVENLEDRMMLSTVQIYAAGSTGQEALNLRVDNQVVASFSDIGGDASAREFVELEFQTDQTINGGQVSVEFINDLFDPSRGIDRDLFIDRIVIDGVTHQTEGPSVFHTGLYQDGGFTGPGVFRTETLNTNGTVFFSDQNVPRDPVDLRQVTFVARGTTGDEVVSLSIDGVVVDSFQLTQSNQQFEFQTDRDFTADQLQFSFDNDLFDSANGIDRNVTLEFLEFENLATRELTRFTGEDSNVFSTGTYRNDDGITPGFGRGNTLHANGFFSFGNGSTTTPTPNPTPTPTPNPTPSSGSVIRFTASGATGEEVAQVLVGDEVVFETVVQFSSTLIGGERVRGEYEVVLDQDVDLSDIRIAFVNDGLSATGQDRDLFVDYVTVRDLDTGEIQRTTAADESTFSTGTFVGSSLESGFGRGFALHTNGFFQFTNSSRLLIDASGSTGEERFRVFIADQVVGEFGVGDGTTNEFESTSTSTIAVDVPQSVSIQDVRIEFINDGFDANGADRNLTISSLRLDGTTYDTDSAFSTGTFLDSDGVSPGTGRGDTLHANGFFQFGAVTDSGAVNFVNFRGGASIIVTHLDPDNSGPNPFGPFDIHQEESGDIVVRLTRPSSFGLDAGSVTFQVQQSNFEPGPIPSNVSQDPVTVFFEDGDLAANLVIPVVDNNVPNGGMFQLSVIDTSEGLLDFAQGFTIELQDADA